MIEELSALGMEFLAAPAERYIDGGRGGGDGSLRMINDKLFYDQQREIDLTNTPTPKLKSSSIHPRSLNGPRDGTSVPARTRWIAECSSSVAQNTSMTMLTPKLLGCRSSPDDNGGLIWERN